MLLLHRFPIHTLKVDQVFIKDVSGNAESAAIATTILVLATSLGLIAVAEGVETWEQFEFLKARGRDEMQVFLFSPPCPLRKSRLFSRPRV